MNEPGEEIKLTVWRELTRWGIGGLFAGILFVGLRELWLSSERNHLTHAERLERVTDKSVQVVQQNTVAIHAVTEVTGQLKSAVDRNTEVTQELIHKTEQIKP
jgi:hypothetical protein